MTAGLTNVVATDEYRAEKGPKGGALGLLSTTVVGVASTPPAYSLAATLGFVVVAIGAQAPIVTVLRVYPDALRGVRLPRNERGRSRLRNHVYVGDSCVRPKTGWLGGWAIIAADVLAMASLAQIAGQYLFLLFNTNRIGSNAGAAGSCWWASPGSWPYGDLLRGNRDLGQIPKGAPRHRTHHAPCPVDRRPGQGGWRHGPPGHLGFSWSWCHSFAVPSPASAFINGVLLMLFIYWGSTPRSR